MIENGPPSLVSSTVVGSDDVINQDERTACIGEEEEVDAGHPQIINRGLFRKFSLKVIEWIRKSLELGRNEVCDVCFLSCLLFSVVSSSVGAG